MEVKFFYTKSTKTQDEEGNFGYAVERAFFVNEEEHREIQGNIRNGVISCRISEKSE